ncbi:MAG: hypothetical protein PHC61_00890, partial [Chitinivibrionales bacterium]|nr:hypothetical protein [Chitinivibrionales bacterium]
MGIKISTSTDLPQTLALAGGGVPAKQVSAENPGKFSEVLASAADALKFSAHAQSRIKSRNIEVTPQIMDKLNTAVQG